MHGKLKNTENVFLAPSMALLVMLLLFLACWAPIHILNIIEDFGVPVCCSCCSKGILVHSRLLTFITITMTRPHYNFTFFLAHHHHHYLQHHHYHYHN